MTLNLKLFSIKRADGHSMVNIVSNGDFQANIGLPQDWVTSGNVNVEAFNGSRRMIFNGGNLPANGSISQDVTGVPIGETVTFSFLYAERGVNTTANVGIRFQIEDANGNIIFDERITGATRTVTRTFTATTNDYTIRFLDASAGNTDSRDPFIDNVVFDVPSVVCFAQGTRLLTPHGLREVETLRPGDQVWTMDNGARQVRWIGCSKVSGRGKFAPIRLAKELFGGARDLYVSPQHRILSRGAATELTCGEPEVLVPALHLVNGETVRQVPCETIAYYHICLAAHEVVFAEGMPSESLFLGDMAHAMLESGARQELVELFPEFGLDYGTPCMARPTVRRHEAALIGRQMQVQ